MIINRNEKPDSLTDLSHTYVTSLGVGFTLEQVLRYWKGTWVARAGALVMDGMIPLRRPNY
jgi:hypothetical protein